MTIDTLDSILLRAASSWPERPALVDEEGRAETYRALDSKASAVSSKLLSLGIGLGARIAILSRNSAWSVAAYFGILRAGGVVVFLNYSLNAKDLAEIVSDSRPSVLIYEKELYSKAKDVLAAQPHIKSFTLDENSFGLVGRQITMQNRPDNLAAIVYTSGSTSRSLGVKLSHRNLVSNNAAIANYMKLTADDKVICVLPFYYIYGLSLMLSHFMVGGSVLMDGRFLYAQTVLDAMEAKRATGFAGVSSHYSLLMSGTDFLERRLPFLRYFAHAGDKMPVATTQKILQHFPGKELFLMYGQTEASPRVSYLQTSLAKTKPSSVGKAIAPDIHIRIVDEAGAVCASGQEGEICVKGPNVMQGYWNAPEETAQVLKDGWLYTGDIGYMDEAGDLFVTGRKKHFLKIGGHRVNPLEIEALTMEFPNVKEAAVIGMDDATWGQTLKVFVVASENDRLKKEELLDFYKKRLPSYKVPAAIEVMPFLPKNSQGKIDKINLKLRTGA